MSFVQMRPVPGLFVGRRTLVCAEALAAEAEGSVYRCGACERPLFADADEARLRDVVVKCACGEFNQL